jgi:serine protease
VWVFATHVNPLNAAVELKPLWRMSYKCGDAIPSGRPNICAAHPYHVDHFYTTDVNELITYKSSHGYRPDGVEGYVYSATLAQPMGTTALLRAFKAADDDYAIFPFEQKAAMAALGYSGSLTTLGYVYLNSTGARPVY